MNIMSRVEEMKARTSHKQVVEWLILHLTCSFLCSHFDEVSLCASVASFFRQQLCQLGTHKLFLFRAIAWCVRLWPLAESLDFKPSTGACDECHVYRSISAYRCCSSQPCTFGGVTKAFNLHPHLEEMKPRRNSVEGVLLFSCSSGSAGVPHRISFYQPCLRFVI